MFKRIGLSPILIILLAMIFLFMVSCHEMDGADNESDKEMIEDLPLGFVNLDDAAASAEGIMTYSFFEEYFSLVDMDGYSVGGSLVTDSSLIIRLQGQYYVNEGKFLDALEVAKISPEQRRKRYSPDGAIEVRGAGDSIYFVEITAIDSTRINDATTYTIKYTITSDVADSGQKPLISDIDAKDGVSYSVLGEIDPETLSTAIVANRVVETLVLSVDIMRSSEIDTITFLSPDFPWLVYIIAVDK